MWSCMGPFVLKFKKSILETMHSQELDQRTDWASHQPHPVSSTADPNSPGHLVIVNTSVPDSGTVSQDVCQVFAIHVYSSVGSMGEHDPAQTQKWAAKSQSARQIVKASLNTSCLFSNHHVCTTLANFTVWDAKWSRKCLLFASQKCVWLPLRTFCHLLFTEANELGHETMAGLWTSARGTERSERKFSLWKSSGIWKEPKIISCLLNWCLLIIVGLNTVEFVAPSQWPIFSY